jgi:hypothetical protein
MFARSQYANVGEANMRWNILSTVCLAALAVSASAAFATTQITM